MNFDTTFAQMWQGAIFVAIIFAYLYVAKLIADWRTSDFDDDHEIEENSNPAVGYRRAGLYIGIAIAMFGAVSGTSQGLGADVVTLLVDGALVLILMFVARAINDGVLLAGINNDKEAVRDFPNGQRGNSAVGIAELGSYIATGFVLKGAFAGEGGDVWAGLIQAVVFFVLAQVALIVLAKVYEMMTPYSVNQEIKKGNPAAGVSFAGMLIALGMILSAAVSGPFTGWGVDIAGFFLWAAYGVVLLLVFRKLIDLLFLPNTTLAIEVERDQNVPALVLTEAVIAAVAIMVCGVIL